MTRALLLPLLLIATASAQAPDDPGLSGSLSDERLRDNVEMLRGLAEVRFGRIESNCDQAVPMPALDLDDGISPAPIPQASPTGGLQPAPMPNLCGQPLAVLPQGVRFRTDPLPLSEDDDLGRQLLREQQRERLRQHYRLLQPPPNLDRHRQRIDFPELERLRSVPLVAPPVDRP